MMYLLSPLWMTMTAAQAVKRGGHMRFFSTRLGWRASFAVPAATPLNTDSNTPNNANRNKLSTKRQPGYARPLWFHAASVGEVKAILPLVNYLKHAWPSLPIHISCTTPESLKLLEKTLTSDISCDYSPIDFYRTTNSMFKRLKPLALLIVETEIWPNLYTGARRHEVPLVIINGRVSKKTLGAPRFVRALYRQVLQHVTIALSRSETDSVGFQKLGLEQRKTKTIGNIKTYTGDVAHHTALPELSGERYLLAASTHQPEEQLLCEALAAPSLPQADMLLVIAPRHVQRSTSIQQMLKEKQIPFATRSRGERITTGTRVYLADTTGEMDRLIADAALVFVGGSLIERGGHNVLEPAAHGKPVFTGPHHENFSDEVEILTSHNAISIVHDAHDLSTVCERLATQPDSLDEMGKSAKEAIESSRHIFDQYTAEIDQLITQWQKRTQA
jgi:3-deoxy-D-manno-octulosonic-acid transferase